MFSPLEVQQDVFRKHCALAKELDAPMFLHERDRDKNLLGSHEHLVQILEECDVSPSRVCVHCFTGSEEDLVDFVSRGFMIGVTGFVCKKSRGKQLRDAIQRGLLPLEQLMIETDSPYMNPPKWKQRDNEPAAVYFVAESLAELYSVPIEEIAAITTANAQAFFNL
eukprot:m.136715 g.136715  ORF g.136715 m.136715 type:complete len:166 (+) comp13146_c0_seq1:1440-1937(+)